MPLCKNCNHDAHLGEVCPEYLGHVHGGDPACSCRSYEPQDAETVALLDLANAAHRAGILTPYGLTGDWLGECHDPIARLEQVSDKLNNIGAALVAAGVPPAGAVLKTEAFENLDDEENARR